MPTATYQHETPYKGRSLSRADRCADAGGAGVVAVDAMMTAVQNYQETLPGAPEEGDDPHEEQREEVAELLGELEEVKSAIEELTDSVEFPGMF